ncbi:MAG: DUF3037 domain-containing protein [Flavobacteriales bacterium]
MQGKHLYEYAVIRVLPAVHREEFLNAGIILFCKSEDLIKVHLALNEEKLRCLAGDVDHEQVRLNLRSFERIALASADGGPIARLDAPSRFRWLTAVRSSAIQTSRPHPGYCDDLAATAQRLFEELVL